MGQLLSRPSDAVVDVTVPYLCLSAAVCVVSPGIPAPASFLSSTLGSGGTLRMARPGTLQAWLWGADPAFSFTGVSSDPWGTAGLWGMDPLSATLAVLRSRGPRLSLHAAAAPWRWRSALWVTLVLLFLFQA